MTGTTIILAVIFYAVAAVVVRLVAFSIRERRVLRLLRRERRRRMRAIGGRQ